MVSGKKSKLPPLVTSVLSPANGTQVSRTVALDAGAMAGHLHVTRVAFYLNGPSHKDTRIGIGRLSLVGWLALWNSTEVTNGSYSIHSVAFDASGRSSKSKSITVAVRN